MSAKRPRSDVHLFARYRPVIWLSLLTLILSLVGPLVTIDAADARSNVAPPVQGVPPNCDETFEPNAEGTECVPVADDGETEQSADDPENGQQSPTDDQQGQLPADDEQGSGPGLPISLDDQQRDDLQQPDDQQQDQEIQQPPADEQQGQQEQPPADDQEANEQPPQDLDPQGPTSIQSQPTASNSLDVYKLVCQVTAPPPADASLTWFEQNCSPVQQWDFNLEWTGGQRTETSDESGHAGWSGLPVGTWTITEFLPESYATPVIWCRYTEWPQGAGVSGEWATFEAPGGVFSNGFGYDQMRMECRFYNISISDEAPDTQDAGSNSLDISKYYCQVAEVPADADLSWYEANCNNPVPQWSFHLTWVGGERTELTDANGRARWSGLPTGPWTVTEFQYLQIPSDVTTPPTVWCRYTEWPPEAGVTDEWAQDEAANDSYSNGFGYDQMRMECRWYDIFIAEEAPVAPAGEYNYLDLYKFFCQVPALPPADAALSWYADNCEPVPQWDFHLEWTTGESTVTTNGDGRASWSGLPTDSWTASEFLPESYETPVVWCRYIESPEVSGLTPAWMKFEAPNGVLSNSFDSDLTRMECRFYNIAVADANALSMIQFEKYWCPATLPLDEPATLTNLDELQDLALACQQTGPPGASLNLDGPNPPYDSLPIDTRRAAGNWTDLPPGTYTMTEAFQNGVGYRLRVSCFIHEVPPTGNPADIDIPPVWQEWEVIDGSSIQWTAEPGFGWACAFFNLPNADPVVQDAGYNYLDLSKFYCPIPPQPGVDSPLSWYEDNCDPVPEWEFSLEWIGGESTQTTNAGGRASWSGLPVGAWTAREPQLQPGDLPPTVWCRYIEWPDEAGVTGEWALADAPGGVYTNGFGYDQMRMECRFYNVPKPDDPVAQDAGYNYLDLAKLYCQVPAPPAAEADLTWYEQNCEPVPGWDFQLTWTGGEGTETTDQNGQAARSGLPTGTWTATEFVPDFYEPPVVWCRYTEWPPEAGITDQWARFEAEQDPANPSLYSYQNGFGYDQMRMECRFYNIYVAAEDDYNYLDLSKYYCQVPALPPADAELTWYEDNCDPVAQWDFQLEWVGGERTETTDAAGRARWSGLPTGTWTATEFLPDFYETPVVWCRYTEWPDEAGVTDQWAKFEAPGGVYSNGFGYDQMRMECRFYNLALEDENTVTVYKWDCLPGTEYGRSLDYYQGVDQDEGPCETEHLDVPMILTDASGQHPMPTQPNGTQWGGIELLNGGFQITEQIPPAYGDPMVYCGLVDDGRTQTPVESGTITLTPATEPFAYQCDWYNLPFDVDYQLELYKFLCGPDVDPSLGLPDLGTSCSPAEGISFTATFGANPPSARYTDQFGRIFWTEAQMGDWTLREAAMPGWGPPKVYCGPPQTTETPEVPVNDLTVAGTLDPTTPRIICAWFNFEREVENGRITIYKYQCPPGTTSDDLATLQAACTVPFNGVNFTLRQGANAVSAATVGGVVDWVDLDDGSYLVREDLLPGYEEPRVWCGYVRRDGVDLDPAAAQFTSYPVADGTITVQLNELPSHLVCYWYNLSTAPGAITINKWLCPPGYDMQTWGADPTRDCTIAQDGVTYTLDRPAGADLTASTGDSLTGAVQFGGLDPGAYTITEVVPSDIAYVFVLDCTGTNIPKVHQRPLSWSNRLDVNLAAGDAIVCNWYDVPNPEDGWVTVTKYQCWTTRFTSAVDCEIFEFGASFELVGVPSGTSFGAGTTDAAGNYTWGNLDAGSYRLDEFSHQPCKATASKVDAMGNIRVDAGEGTTVKVYNCRPATPSAPGTPPVARPGKAPVKYPNTGTAPLVDGLRRPALQATPEGTPGDGALTDAEYYRLSCLEETPDLPAASPTPTESDPAAVPSTPTEFDLAIPTVEARDESAPIPTPRATSDRVVIVSRSGERPGTPVPGDDADIQDECARGALPARVVIEAANVDAGVETLEVIDGVMQQPTGPTDVAWYKETGRLGEANNVVIAGHLNWWNVPEGVFFRLRDLRAGDRVELTGDDGRVYVYEVQWVRQESNLEPPAAAVIGPTAEPTLTLITCGGEWNAEIAEYDERTVARAIQVDVIAAEDADEGSGTALLGRAS